MSSYWCSCWSFNLHIHVDILILMFMLMSFSLCSYLCPPLDVDVLLSMLMLMSSSQCSFWCLILLLLMSSISKFILMSSSLCSCWCPISFELSSSLGHVFHLHVNIRSSLFLWMPWSHALYRLIKMSILFYHRTTQPFQNTNRIKLTFF